MKHDISTRGRVRGSVIAVLGFAALVAGCEGKMPTAAEVEKMDVASASSRLGADPAAIYVVDQKVVTKAEAMGLKPENIASIEVVKRTDYSTDPVKFVIRTREGVASTMTDVHGFPASASPPLVLLNGVSVDESVLKGLDRNDIESVEVIKGKAAIKQFGDRGKNGVIVIVTKAGTQR
jgi:hypothetical protein